MAGCDQGGPNAPLQCYGCDLWFPLDDIAVDEDGDFFCADCKESYLLNHGDRG